jgi:hypothetical protein
MSEMTAVALLVKDILEIEQVESVRVVKSRGVVSGGGYIFYADIGNAFRTISFIVSEKELNSSIYNIDELIVPRIKDKIQEVYNKGSQE